MDTASKNSVIARCRTCLVLTATLLATACGVNPSARAPQTEIQDENGFTIREDIQVSGDVRQDFNMALRMLEQEQYEQAIVLLESVTDSAPEATAAYINLGIAHGRIGDLENAEISIGKALTLNPRHPVAHNEMGMIYRRTGRFDAARQSYEKALSLHPEFHFARLNLAILCDVYLADLECALENYELYRAAVPDDEEASMWIADLRNRAGH
jgi:Flp pilus assembly protein TadD